MNESARFLQPIFNTAIIVKSSKNHNSRKNAYNAVAYIVAFEDMSFVKFHNVESYYYFPNQMYPFFKKNNIYFFN